MGVTVGVQIPQTSQREGEGEERKNTGKWPSLQDYSRKFKPQILAQLPKEHGLLFHKFEHSAASGPQTLESKSGNLLPNQLWIFLILFFFSCKTSVLSSLGLGVSPFLKYETCTICSLRSNMTILRVELCFSSETIRNCCGRHATTIWQ